MRAVQRILAPLIVTALLGIATTLVLAVGIARLASPPENWAVHSDRTRAYLPGYEEFFRARPETDRLQIFVGLRPGVRVLDIRHFEADAFYELPHPPRVQRRFITEVGWPSPALMTESPSVGGRFALDQRDLDGPFLDTSGWRMIGRGIVFNSLVFAATWLPATVWFRSSRRVRGIPLYAACCVCVALWLALGLAWAAYFLHDPSTYSIFTWSDAEYESLVGPVARPPKGVPWNSFQGGKKRSFGSRVEEYHIGQTAIAETGDTYYATIAVREYRHRLGWPMYAFDTNEQLRPAPTAPNAGVLYRFPVYWPGLLANWLFFAAILLGAVCVPPWIRARWRIRSKRCAACGYPVGQSAVCTECGAAVSTADVQNSTR